MVGRTVRVWFSATFTRLRCCFVVNVLLSLVGVVIFGLRFWVENAWAEIDPGGGREEQGSKEEEGRD